MKKTALLVMVITLLSKFLGFGREVVLSYYFGASEISDIYLISMTIPAVIISFVASGIATAYIPIQSKLIIEQGLEVSNKYTSNFINIVLLLASAIVGLAFVFTPYLVKIFAYGFTGETLDQAVIFTRIMLLGIYFTILIAIFSGYLQINNNYMAPALIGFPMNIVVIISIYVASKGNYYILALGSLMSMAAQFVILIPFIIKEKFKYYPSINFRDPDIKQTLNIALPVIFASSIGAINNIVDKTIASTIAVGGISALNYANKLTDFAMALFVASIITVLYPTISKFAGEGNFEKLKSTLKEAINLMVIFIVPITIGAVIFSREVVWMIYGRGEFDEVAIQLTSAVLLFYALGMLGSGVRTAISRGFFALQDTKTPMFNAAIGITINIILNIILSHYMGIGGLALATSISLTVVAVMLFISFRKKVGPFGMMEVVVNVGKVSIASAIMGVAAKFVYDYLLVALASNTLALLSAIAVGALVYFVIIYFMRIRDVDIMVNAVKGKVKGLLD